MSDAPEKSPALLAATPKRGVGVRRLNKLPIVFVIGGAMLVVAAIGYTYRDRLMQSAANAQQASSHKAEPGNGSAVLNGAPVGGEVEPEAARTPLPGGLQGASPKPAQVQPPSMPSDNSGAWQRIGAGRGRRHQSQAGSMADVLCPARPAPEGPPDCRYLRDVGRHRP